MDFWTIYGILAYKKAGDSMLTCTFFGHKDTPKEIEPTLRSTLIDLIENKNVCNFYVGNHGSFDHMVKHILTELSEIYPISYTVVLAYLPGKKPNPDEESPAGTILPEGIEAVPQKFAVSYRNKWMIEQSNYVVAYVKYAGGGAGKFKELAEKKKRTVINIAAQNSACPHIFVCYQGDGGT